MSDLGRWAPPLHLGPFRFQPDASEFVSLALTQRDGQMMDREGRSFCTLQELQATGPPSWRGLPALVVKQENGPGLFVLWPDARGIDDPDAFRARVLGLP